MGQRLPRHPREEEQGALQGRGPLRLGGVVGAGQRRAPGVVDEDVEAPEALDGRGHEVADRLVAIEIAGERQHVGAHRVAKLPRGLVEVLPRAAAERQACALLGEHPGARAPQPLAGAADDRDLAP